VARYRGLADNTVGKIIDTLLRADLVIIDEVGFAPLDDNGIQLLFRLVAAAYERRFPAVGSHLPFEQWGRFLSEDTTAQDPGPAHTPRQRRDHRRRVVPHAPRPTQARRPPLN
jgi:hypothetical protein